MSDIFKKSVAVRNLWERCALDNLRPITPWWYHALRKGYCLIGVNQWTSLVASSVWSAIGPFKLSFASSSLGPFGINTLQPWRFNARSEYKRRGLPCILLISSLVSSQAHWLSCTSSRRGADFFFVKSRRTTFETNTDSRCFVDYMLSAFHITSNNVRNWILTKII